MPNHVTTICTVTGPTEAVDAFVAAHIRPRDDGKGDHFDFKTVIPMPECVEGTESGSEADAGFYALTGLHKVEFAFSSQTPMHSAAQHLGFPMGAMTTHEDYARWLAEKNPDAIEKGKRQLRCFRETGCLSWYDWSVENWGTKWGSYDYVERSREPGRFVFKFETAWSVPRPIFDKLIGLHPELTFALSSIDEGGPEYEAVYSKRVQSFEKMPQSDERYRFVYGEERPRDDDEDEVTIVGGEQLS
jgi:hypothetical protein